MKKSSLRNLGVMAVVLCLVTTCLLGGTLARYTSEVSGNATFTAAKWEFSAKNGENALAQDFTLDIGATANKNIVDGTVAPGSKGSFNIVLDAGDSQVGIDYAIKFKNDSTASLPSGLKFTVDTQPVTLDDPNGITGKLVYDELGAATVTNKTITVNWEWPYGADADDTADAGKTTKLVIEITGTQQALVANTEP